jgi:hypothetical protein
MKIHKGQNPPKAGHDTKVAKYPFASMAINDFFEVPMSLRSTVTVCSISYARRHPEYKFRTQKINDQTLRVWRIKK